MLMPLAPTRPGRLLAHVMLDTKEMAPHLARDARILTNAPRTLITAMPMPLAPTRPGRSLAHAMLDTKEMASLVMISTNALHQMVAVRNLAPTRSGPSLVRVVVDIP